MEKSGSNFHCVKCKIAYMTFDQMYDHIKKYHVSDLLSGLAKLESPAADTLPLEQRGEKSEATPLIAISPREAGPSKDVVMEEMDQDSSEAKKMSEIVARRKNYAEILRKHFYGESSQKVTEEIKSEGKACLENLLRGEEPGKSKPVETDRVTYSDQVTLKDLLAVPSTSTSAPRSTPANVTPELKSSRAPISKADEEKLVILHISQMENLLTNDLLHLYEEEAQAFAPKLRTPKAIPPTSIVDDAALRIMDVEDQEGKGPQVRTRNVEKEHGEEEMETQESLTVNVSGIHPKYKHRKLDAFAADKLRKRKVVSISSGSTSTQQQPEPRRVYVPVTKKEIEYDSEEECYFILENMEPEPDPEKERQDAMIRETLDDKFGGINAARNFDPYFEYLWKESFEIKDRMYDNSDIKDVVKSHAWSYPRL